MLNAFTILIFELATTEIHAEIHFELVASRVARAFRALSYFTTPFVLAMVAGDVSKKQQHVTSVRSKLKNRNLVNYALY